MYKVYQVKYGDTLDSIAKKFNTTIYELKNINNMENIKDGDLIVVPNYSNSNYFDVYTIKKGDTLYNIALNNNISVIDLARINGIHEVDYIYPNQELLIPKDNIKIVITDKEDTLDSVSNKIGIDKYDIVKQNDSIYLLPDQLIVYKD